MKQSIRRLLPVLALLTLTLPFSAAQLRLPALFSDNMVLQHKREIPVWGWAGPLEQISVEIGGSLAETTAGRDGKWALRVGPLEAGGPYEMKVTGKTTIRIRNILAGEVWVCSGQSNMAMEVRSCQNAEEEISSASYPEIRHFQVKRSKSSQITEELAGVSEQKNSWLNTWEICDSTTVGHFSATAYFFARSLHAQRNIPVGLIHSSWGGTTAEAWTPRETLESNPELRDILGDWPAYNDDEEWLAREYQDFCLELEKARAGGQPEPLYFNQPSVLFNAMIAPLIPFEIRGVAWYQGESNAYRAPQYRKLFPALIASWREQWAQGDFPFLFVQLANYHFEAQVFPELREAQSAALSLPQTAMVVAIDIGDSSDIHPKNKQEVGRRLALAALKTAYGEAIESSGPVYTRMQVEENRCRLWFDQVADGLQAKGNASLKGFTIAGKDRIFKEARATLDGNQILVWNEQIDHPLAVRYAWANHPSGCNLYNRLGGEVHLPASPFRTDNWDSQDVLWDQHRKQELAIAASESLHRLALYSEEMDIVNGPKWSYSKIYKGNPFLAESYWPKATLSYGGKQYSGFQLNYDLYEETLVLLYEKENQTKYIVLFKDYLDSLSYTDSATLQSHKFVYIQLPDNRKKALYEKAYEGESTFLIRHRCSVTGDPSGAFAGRYQRSFEYYIQSRGSYERVYSRSTLLDALEAYRPEIKKYIRKNRLKINSKKAEPIISVLEYFDQLQKLSG